MVTTLKLIVFTVKQVWNLEPKKNLADSEEIEVGRDFIHVHDVIGKFRTKTWSLFESKGSCIKDKADN